MTRIPMLACLALTAVAALTEEAAAASDSKGALSRLGREIHTTMLAQNPTPSTTRGIIPKEVETLVAAGKTTTPRGAQLPRPPESALNC